MQNDKKHILVVDDDNKLRNLIIEYLRKENFLADGAADAGQVDDFLTAHDTDLVILDVMLPGEDGLSIARRLLATRSLPILMLSAKGEDIDRIIGLEIGADDYLTKPFNPRELVARVKAILRRAAPLELPTAKDIFRFGDFTFNISAHTLIYGEQNIALTTGEFDLLEAFVRHPNRILSRDQLIAELKGYDRSPFDRSIDVRVTRLRKKLESVTPGGLEFIRTIWGKGYLFTPQGRESSE